VWPGTHWTVVALFVQRFQGVAGFIDGDGRFLAECFVVKMSRTTPYTTSFS